MVFIRQLDHNVQRLILALAEQVLRSQGYSENEIPEALENVQDEKIVNVIDELTRFVENDLALIIEDAIAWQHMTGEVR